MSTRTRHPLWIGASAVVLAALSSTCARAAQGDFASILSAATAAQTQAVADNCAWSITAPAIAKAQKLHAQGQDAAAASAAAHAKDLAALSLKQCAEQKTAWKRAVVR